MNSFVENELARLADSYRSYHVQKENISWIALGLLFALVAGLIDIVYTTDLGISQLIVIAISGTTFTALFLAFILSQLHWKKVESAALAATERLRAKIADGTVLPEEIDLSREEGSFLPKSVVKEMKGSGQAKGFQKHVVSFTVVTHLLLEIVLIGSCVVNMRVTG